MLDVKRGRTDRAWHTLAPVVAPGHPTLHNNYILVCVTDNIIYHHRLCKQGRQNYICVLSCIYLILFTNHKNVADFYSMETQYSIPNRLLISVHNRTDVFDLYRTIVRYLIDVSIIQIDKILCYVF